MLVNTILSPSTKRLHVERSQHLLDDVSYLLLISERILRFLYLLNMNAKPFPTFFHQTNGFSQTELGAYSVINRNAALCY